MKSVVLLLCSPLFNIDGGISLYDLVFWFTNVYLITNFIHGDVLGKSIKFFSQEKIGAVRLNIFLDGLTPPLSRAKRD